MNVRAKGKVKGKFFVMCIVHNIGKIISKIQAKVMMGSNWAKIREEVHARVKLLGLFRIVDTVLS